MGQVGQAGHGFSTALPTYIQLSPQETICMKCQILFSRKNIVSLSSAEFAHSMVLKETKAVMVEGPVIDGSVLVCPMQTLSL